MAILLFMSCNKKQDEEISLLKNKIFCVDGSEKHEIYYKQVYSFDVNELGEIFISNDISNRIDAYTQQGEYQYSIGNKGEGPGEFHTGISVFKCTKDKMIVFDISGRLIVFDRRGNFKIEKRISDMGINGYVLKICSFENSPIIYFIDKNEYWIAILKDNLEIDRLFVTPIKDRKLPVRFRSDIGVDENGKIYVTDNYEYAIYVYDLNGKRIKSFKKKINKNKIAKSDFIVYSDNEIIQHPAAERLKKLNKIDKFWPCICGINIDKKRIFVWKTDLSINGECLVDVYDDNWNYLHEYCCYNGLTSNFIIIVNKKIYTLSAKEPYPVEIVRQLGKFGGMGNPDQLCVYSLPESVY